MIKSKTKIDPQRPNVIVPGLENTNTLRTEIHLVGHVTGVSGVGKRELMCYDATRMFRRCWMVYHSSEIAPRRRSDLWIIFTVGCLFGFM